MKSKAPNAVGFNNDFKSPIASLYPSRRHSIARMLAVEMVFRTDTNFVSGALSAKTSLLIQSRREQLCH